MNTYQKISEDREIKDVRRVILRDYGQLIITQAEEESLTIEGPDQYLRMVKSRVSNGELLLDIDGGWWDKTWNAITSAIERRPVVYHLKVKTLDGLFVSGAGSVRCEKLDVEDLHLILKGAGEMILRNCSIQSLHAELPGAGIISISGKASHQDVVLRGAGSYDAPRLETEVTAVRLKGVGKASVWATKQLEARVEGVGSIEYHGNPELRKSVSGLGNINHKMS